MNTTIKLWVKSKLLSKETFPWKILVKFFYSYYEFFDKLFFHPEGLTSFVFSFNLFLRNFTRNELDSILMFILMKEMLIFEPKCKCSFLHEFLIRIFNFFSSKKMLASFKACISSTYLTIKCCENETRLCKCL